MASLTTAAAVSSVVALASTVPRVESVNGFSSPLRFAPIQAKPLRSRAAGSRRVVVMASPDVKDISEKISKAVEDAKESCAGNEASGECAAAWDEVEELSAARAHKAALDKELNQKDPLEVFCEENPETDECRIYSD